MVAVNTALEIDLTGQVCADSIGSKFFSGVGGQVDFNRGAAKSQRRQGHHRPALHRQGRHRFAHHDASEPRRRRRHHPRGRALRRDRIRRGLSARQEHPGTRAGAHQHRASEIPRRPAPRRHRREISFRRDGRQGRAKSSSARRNCARPTCSTTARSSTSARFIRPTNRGCATCSTNCPRRRFITAS